jgi:hypothetical protein
MAGQSSLSYGKLLELQHGVVARWQAGPAGLAGHVIDAKLRQGRWQHLYRGVYASFTGPLPRTTMLWAAVLRAGPDALLSHYSAAELDKLLDRPGEAIHVTISSARQARISSQEIRGSCPSIIVHRSARIGSARHPVRTPPRTRVEDTTLDLAEVAADVDGAIAWLTRACSRRLTTPQLLRAALQRRAKVRWRTDLAAALLDIGDGVHSMLESRYVRGVERAHGLPVAIRQDPTVAGGHSRYLDNHYPEYGLAVELDGRAAHPPEARWQDIHRDNAVAAAGITTLRYSWADVTGNPCGVAAEVARVLALRGWTGALRPCGPGCTAAVP